MPCTDSSRRNRATGLGVVVILMVMYERVWERQVNEGCGIERVVSGVVVGVGERLGRAG